MCGILGVLPSQDEHFFLNSLNRIKHRGPDGCGIWHDDNFSITLGHRRLSILDLSENGKQPMSFGNHVITYNGEIYNFLEIKKELELKGYRFKTDSDTEILLASFIEYGPECLNKFNGMWAFGIWDKSNQQLFLARDRFGVKPLFYAFIEDKFVFASEMKAIMPFLPSILPSDDFEWCKDNMFDYESSNKCLIKGIKRFPAGHYAWLDFKKKKLHLTQYWSTLETLFSVPDRYEEQVEIFRDLFFDACKIRMRSDVPIGTSLSGGVDSSAIICAMANIKDQDLRISNSWQHAFVALFPDTNLDESYYAQKVVDYLGIDATYELLTQRLG